MVKYLVIYDSLFGNTEKIARAIGETLVIAGESSILRVGVVKMDTLEGVELMIVGSPTQGFRPTEAMKAFLKAIPDNQLKGIKVAAFDTRFTPNNINKTPVLPYFVKIFGYAAEPIAKALQNKSGKLVISPEGFYVDGKEGPLVEGELERAVTWARNIIRK
jgi:flavodoxin